jgi:hypothetical protein
MLATITSEYRFPMSDNWFARNARTVIPDDTTTQTDLEFILAASTSTDYS